MLSQKIAQTEKCINHISKINDVVILFWSATGKDSIALLSMLQPHFKKVVCVCKYLVKDLELLNPFFLWAKKFPNVEVIQVPSPALFQYKRDGVYQVKKFSNLKLIKDRDIEEWLKREYNTPLIVNGSKRGDNFVNAGVYNKASKSEFLTDYDKYYPLVNWKNKEVLAYIHNNKLPKPLTFGSKSKSSGISLGFDCLLWLFGNFPRDFKKVCAEFPLIEAEFKLNIIPEYGNNEISEI